MAFVCPKFNRVCVVCGLYVCLAHFTATRPMDQPLQVRRLLYFPSRNPYFHSTSPRAVLDWCALFDW